MIKTLTRDEEGFHIMRDKNSMMRFKVVTKLVSNLMTDHHFLILHEAWTVIFISNQQHKVLARERRRNRKWPRGIKVLFIVSLGLASLSLLAWLFRHLEEVKKYQPLHTGLSKEKKKNVYIFTVKFFSIHFLLGIITFFQFSIYKMFVIPT